MKHCSCCQPELPSRSPGEVVDLACCVLCVAVCGQRGQYRSGERERDRIRIEAEAEAEIERRRKIERASHLASTLACLLAIRSAMVLSPAAAAGLVKRALWKMKSLFIQYHQVALKPLALRVLPVCSDLSPDFDSMLVMTIFKVPSSMM